MVSQRIVRAWGHHAGRLFTACPGFTLNRLGWIPGGILDVHGGLGDTEGRTEALATDANRIGLDTRRLVVIHLGIVIKAQLGDVDDDPVALDIGQDEASGNGHLGSLAGDPDAGVRIGSHDLPVPQVVSPGDIEQGILSIIHRYAVGVADHIAFLRQRIVAAGPFALLFGLRSADECQPTGQHPHHCAFSELPQWSFSRCTRVRFR